MGRETHKRPERELSETDRLRIAAARDTLKQYEQEYNFDTPEPLSELGYEQRMARARAIELAANYGFGKKSDETIQIAQKFYQFIWRGNASADL